jgi:hypothetical protein
MRSLLSRGAFAPFFFVGAAASSAEGADFRLLEADGRPAAGVTVTVVGRNARRF